MPGARRPPVFAIALLSAAALAYEILLTRLFSIIQWHHFAYMIISLALLGFGASGSFLYLTRSWWRKRIGAAFVTNAGLFGLLSSGCFLIAQSLPFNAMELFWDSRQPLLLVDIYVLLALPFFCTANCICLAFQHFATDINRIYAFDLVGAGAGGLVVVALLWVMPALPALYAISALGFLSAAIGAVEMNGVRSRLWTGPLLGALLLPVVLHNLGYELQPSPYKGLVQALRVPETTIVEHRFGPLADLAVIESSRIPLRHAPGLSLRAESEPPAQLGLFSDAEGLSPITRFDGDLAPLGYLDAMTTALPYHLLKEPRVLVLGAGGGSEVLQALVHKAAHVDAVELNAQVVDLVRRRFGDYAGHLYDLPQVKVHIAEARGFVAASTAHYDLIQLALVDAFNASSAGLYALSESYLYTTEALVDYLSHLRAGGLLAISRWVRLPPRDAPKLLATAVAALRQLSVAEPENHLVLIRGWQTTTLLVKQSVFTPRDINSLKNFCRERAFDLAYYPGMPRREANHYNVLAQANFFDAARALLGDKADEFIARYKFDIRPATDDRPYFFSFFRWASLAELVRQKAHGGFALLEWGYLILVLTLAQAIALGLVLMLLPLAFNKIQSTAERTTGRGACWLYFFAIGLAFLFIEIAFIHKLTLFLHHPLYAIAVVLSAFLIFAGLGSHFAMSVSEFLRRHWPPVPALYWIIGGLITVAAIELALMPVIFQWGLGITDSGRILISILLIAPLATLMGMPFPLGMARLAERSPALIPWAWAINGCASVISAVLATLLAIDLGFDFVIAAALALYLLAAVVRL